MTSQTSLQHLLLAVAFLLAFAPLATMADEGMWLFNNPPRSALKERYGFEPTEKWLTHVQQSAVRFNSGGSGSFVSPDGLVMTNHHVGADALAKLSTADKDYLKIGFYAKTRAEEVKCVDLELNVLMSIEDVTDRITAAVKQGTDPADAEQARRAIMNTIEKESTDKTGLRSDVVTLYQGGQYHLYRYKKYTDVRLVFAPEQAIAFFGGDPDNFEFPRYDLDICFFRVYENDKPAKPEHYLRWSANGAKDGELIFVAGHPGRTDRLNTMNHLRFMRDRVFPNSLNVLRRREVLLKTFGERNEENARQAADDLFGYQNSRKARLGGLAGLQSPSIMEPKQVQERNLISALAHDDKLKDSRGAIEGVDMAIAAWDKIYTEHYLFEVGQAFNTELFKIARELVRMAAENEKPNAQRLREYRESNLDSLKQQLYSEAPIYEEMEILKLADSLGMMLEMRGGDDALARKILDGKSPRERAAALVHGTKLKEVANRKKVADGKLPAIQSSDDPMIELARFVDEPARKIRKKFESEVEEPLRQAYAKISRARYVLYGTDTYPDATFTLRLAFGRVQGFQEDGKAISAFTTVGGAYEHAKAHGSKPPFELPELWIKRKDKLKLETPFNFVSTADIIGGNSGSPVINREAELVGIIFDGNIQSLVLDFVYTDKVARAVSVHSAAITECLRSIYQAKLLADELQGRPGEDVERGEKAGKFSTTPKR